MTRAKTILTTAAVSATLAATVLSGQASAGRAAGAGPAASHQGLSAFGLTMANRLASFNLGAPGQARIVRAVTGLTGDTRLVGIDFRVQDRRLYGVGDAGGVYTVNTGTARATRVSQLTVPLDGTRFGVDFNPAADRLRVISDTGQNLRHDVNPGGTTTLDGPLTYPATPTTPAVPGTGITGAAYTNNDLDADTSTTLFDLDTALDQTVVQAPANSGMLSATGVFGVNAGTDAGFDIYTELRDGTAETSTGWASLRVGAARRLFSVNLLTGDVDPAGTFPSRVWVTDLAIGLDR